MPEPELGPGGLYGAVAAFVFKEAKSWVSFVEPWGADLIPEI